MNTAEMIKIANRLRGEIEKSGLTATEFAKITNITASTLSRLLNGKQKITEKYLKKAAEALGVSVDYLLLKTDKELKISSNHVTMVKSEDPTIKMKAARNLLEGRGYEILEYFFFSNEKFPQEIWVMQSENNYYKSNINDLEYDASHFANKKAITKKQLAEKIKNFHGEIDHNIRITTPHGKQYFMTGTLFYKFLMMTINTYDNLIIQFLECQADSLINPIDTLIKYKNTLIQSENIEI